jgi:NADPH2:quinone reductase
MSKTKIPDTMKVAVLNAYEGAEALSIEQRPVPSPGRGEVLVKVAFSPINPSDLATLKGHYGFKDPTPIVPGGEGAGEVVAAGPGFMANYFMGKKVACAGWGTGGGVWSEYVVKSVKGGVLPLNKSLSLEQGAMSIINPLTARAFINISKKGGHKTIVLTAAASALGQMVNNLRRNEGIQIINIVRRDQQVDLLKAQGADIVLNSNATGFEQRLHDACHQTNTHLAFDAVAGKLNGADIVLNSNATGFEQRLHDACHQTNTHLAFDAVAGKLTNQVLKAMPKSSKAIVYSALSEQRVQLSPDQLIFENKKVDGFWLGPWISNQNLIKIMRLWRSAQQQIPNELKSEIRKTYPLHEVKAAIHEYTGEMTAGKILLSMS